MAVNIDQLNTDLYNKLVSTGAYKPNVGMSEGYFKEQLAGALKNYQGTGEISVGATKIAPTGLVDLKNYGFSTPNYSQEQINTAKNTMASSGNANASEQDINRFIEANPNMDTSKGTLFDANAAAKPASADTLNNPKTDGMGNVITENKPAEVNAAGMQDQSTGLNGQNPSQQVRDYASEKGLSFDQAYNELASSKKLEGTGIQSGGSQGTNTTRILKPEEIKSLDAAFQRVQNGTANEKDATNVAYAIKQGFYTPNAPIPDAIQKKSSSYVTSTDWGKFKSSLTDYQLQTATYKDANGDIFFKDGYNAGNIGNIPREDPKTTTNNNIDNLYDTIDKTKTDAKTEKDMYKKPDTTGTTPLAPTTDEIKNLPVTNDANKAAKDDLAKYKLELDAYDAQLDQLKKDIKSEVAGEASDSYISALAAVRGEDILKLRKVAQSKYDTALSTYNLNREEAKTAYDQSQDTANRDTQMLSAGYEKLTSIAGLDPKTYVNIGGVNYKKPVGTKDVSIVQGKDGAIYSFDKLNNKLSTLVAGSGTDASDVVTIGSGETGFFAYNKSTGEITKITQGTGKTPTEFQTRYAVFGKQADEANKQYENTLGQEYIPSQKDQALINQIVQQMDNGTPFVGPIVEQAARNGLSEQGRQFLTNVQSFSNAMARIETGAAVKNGEWQMYYNKYFPTAGNNVREAKLKSTTRLSDINTYKDASGGASEKLFPNDSSSASNDNFSTIDIMFQ